MLLMAGLSLTNCSTQKILMPESQHIVGHYRYVHSWDYAGPNKEKMHCDEEGTLDFHNDGTYADSAVQHHLCTKSDTCILKYDFNYRCIGNWKVENHLFLFNELAEEFVMEYLAKQASEEQQEFAQRIAAQSTPDSKRWISFEIERLDRHWFVWSYTYPDGHKDLWEMKRVK